MSRFQRRSDIPNIFRVTFNKFPQNLILNITKFAQSTLRQQSKVPFINKTEDGCYANFESKEMADRVKELVSIVVSHTFPKYCNFPLLKKIFLHCIGEQDENDFISYVEDNVFFLFHQDEKISERTIEKMIELVDHMVSHKFPEPINVRLLQNICFHSIDEQDENNIIFYVQDNEFFLFHLDKRISQRTIEKMTEMLDKYMIPQPIVLVSELLASCSIKLPEEEILMISCGMKTFLKPILNKEVEFMKAFSKTLSRIVIKQVKCSGIDFYDVKNVCKEICKEHSINGVYFYITPEHVELSGLKFNVEHFSEILKIRLMDVPSKACEVSRK
jgi:heat shock protein HspQ